MSPIYGPPEDKEARRAHRVKRDPNKHRYESSFVFRYKFPTAPNTSPPAYRRGKESWSLDGPRMMKLIRGRPKRKKNETEEEKRKREDEEVRAAAAVILVIGGGLLFLWILSLFI